MLAFPFPALRRRTTSVLLASSLLCSLSSGLQAQVPGGFIEVPLDLSTALEPVLSRSEINAFVPSKGKFTFPAPYNTEAVRLTNAADCGGNDCVNAIGYSYWRNINNHVGQDTMLIMVGFNKARGGAGLSLLQYNKVTSALTNLGPLFPANSSYGYASGEGWYFSATLPTKMYLNSGAQILRYDVLSKQFETVVDVSAHLGSGRIVHQIHSSNDDRVHSATIRNASSYEMLGCMAYESDTRQFHYFPKRGDYDECQIDKSGKWLVIKENVDGAEGEDNRIINLDTGNERLLRDSDGAGGHSDLGYGYMVAADNWASAANTQKVWDFNASTLSGVVAYSNRDWSVAVPAHISHSNARPGVAPEQQYACGSSANRRNSVEANEIVCFRLDGSGRALVVAPVMTDLDSRNADDYDNMPKGNLDLTGEYFIWTSNLGSGRLDAFLVRVPVHLLGVSAPAPMPGDSTPPPSGGTTPPPSGSATAAPVVWVDRVNAAADGNSLRKSGGCDGCADAGAASQQRIEGDGYFEFTANVENGLRFVGLGDTNNGTAVNDIDFGLRLQGSVAEVRENGNYRGDLSFKAGDVFRIAVNKGKVTYARNGAVFYTSSVTPARMLRVDTSLYSAGSTVGNAKIAAAALSGALAWTNLVNVSASNGVLQKNAGCDGCPDAGAVSQQQILGGKGHVEFRVTIESKLRGLGLTSIGSGNIAYGINVLNGVAEVRENRVYRRDIAVAAGDVLRVTVENGVVRYLKNGVTFYTSTVPATVPLRAAALFYHSGGTLRDAAIRTH